jgi:hypothetical protein
MNWRTDRGRVTLTTSVAGHEVTVETITDAATIYLRSSVPDQELPPGKEWVGVEPFLGHDPDSALAGSADAGEVLRSLEAAGGDVEDLGEEDVRGVSTTHYRGSIDVDRLEQNLRSEGKADVAKLVGRAYASQTSIPVEVWIDQDGVVRRIREVLPLGGGDSGPGLTMDMQIELYDFGAEPDISLPPADKVFDATPLVKSELGGTEPTPAPAPPATTGAPLPPATFRAKVNRSCARTLDSAKGLQRLGNRLTERWKSALHTEGLDSPVTLRTGQRLAQVYFQPFERIAARWLDQLSKIVPPPSVAGAYRRYQKLNALELEKLNGEFTALEIGDYRVVKQAASGLDGLQKQTRSLEDKLGFDACKSSE